MEEDNDIISEAEGVVKDAELRMVALETLSDMIWVCEVCGVQNKMADIAECPNCGA